MPRPSLPKLIPNIQVKPFTVDTSDKKNIARTLGLKELPPEVEGVIAEAISCFLATEKSSKSTTVANVKVALKDIQKNGQAYNDALTLLADDRSGVDYTTHNSLQALAQAVIAGNMGKKKALIKAARNRLIEIEKHDRIETTTEHLRHFCGKLRVIFNKSSTLEKRSSIPVGWRNCKRFAKAVFSAAHINTANFDENPHRLKLYLGTDVTTD